MGGAWLQLTVSVSLTVARSLGHRALPAVEAVWGARLQQPRARRLLSSQSLRPLPSSSPRFVRGSVQGSARGTSSVERQESGTSWAP